MLAYANSVKRDVWVKAPRDANLCKSKDTREYLNGVGYDRTTRQRKMQGHEERWSLVTSRPGCKAGKNPI